MEEATRHQTDAHARTFIERWQGVSASELSTAQSFVRELCELLGVPHPTPELIQPSFPLAGRAHVRTRGCCW